MCEERWRTRDRLLEYNFNIIPPRPHAAGLGAVYPWENTALNSLLKQIFIIAKQTGFNGTEEDFSTKFGTYLENNGGTNL